MLVVAHDLENAPYLRTGRFFEVWKFPNFRFKTWNRQIPQSGRLSFAIKRYGRRTPTGPHLGVHRANLTV